MWTTVYVEDDGVALVGIEIRGLQQPGLDGRTATLDVEAFPAGWRRGLEQCGIVARNYPPLAALAVQDGDFAQAFEGRVRLGNVATRSINAEADAQRLRGLFALEVGCFDIEAVGAAFAAAHAVED